MGETVCDECGERPYVGPSRDEDVEIEMWCECPENVPAVMKSPRNRNVPDFWGEAGERFVCYQCGEVPDMKTSASGGGIHPKVQYRLSCRCDETTFGPYIGWRGVMPDKWKGDMDPTKWPDGSDEIVSAVEEYGPIDRFDLSECVDLPDGGVKCIVIHLHREDRLYRDGDGKLYTPSMMTEYETETTPEQIEEEVENDESGGGSSLIRTIKGWL